MNEPGELEVVLLGAVEAARGGEPAALGGRKQQALLALLVLDPGRPTTADRLAEELWRGAPPPGWETTLRSYVSRLRWVSLMDFRLSSRAMVSIRRSATSEVIIL